ncbi:MAG TPA: hypothetical protein VFJ71_10690 [Candidatus Limnocylindrales bacterium]|nr:hypothetical protein [Candidatus Limnocylindrales bacterium]
MTDSDRVPAFVEQLVRAVAGGSGDDRDERASTFARGLALGALVGAAIAGSTIWQRRHAARRDEVAASNVPAAEPLAGDAPTG